MLVGYSNASSCMPSDIHYDGNGANDSEISVGGRSLRDIHMKCVPLGGGHHGDTIPFDDSSNLWSFIHHLTLAIDEDMQAHDAHPSSTFHTLWSQLRIHQLTLWAGMID
jgi:hypothetical protein